MRRRRKYKSFFLLLLLGVLILILVGSVGLIIVFSSLSIPSLTNRFRGDGSLLQEHGTEMKTLTLFTTVLEAHVCSFSIFLCRMILSVI